MKRGCAVFQVKAFMTMKRFPSSRTAASCVALVCSIVFAGYAIRHETPVAAQQTPKGSPQPGGSNKPTGGTAAGPGEGGQAVAADPAHGGQAAPAGQARGGLVAYPDRPRAPQAVIDRGKAAFSVNCAFCHGSDAGGGSIGPNLLRSEVVLSDKDGENILPIVHGARAAQGMPKIEIADSSVPDIAAWLHSLKTGGNMRSTEKINILVGNADAGKVAFANTCSSCHSVASMQGFAAKFADPRTMQQTWILPVAMGRGPAANAPKLNVPPVTATVSGPGMQPVTGKLGTIDDFYVEVTTDDGVVHRYTRTNDVPRVEVHDPLEAHRALFRKYNDKEIHDITAYLETLK